MTTSGPQGDNPAIRQLTLDYWKAKAAAGSRLLDGVLADRLSGEFNGRGFEELIILLRQGLSKHPAWLSGQLRIGRRTVPKQVAALAPDEVDRLAREYETDQEFRAQRRVVLGWLQEKEQLTKRDAEYRLADLPENQISVLFAEATASRQRREVLDGVREAAFEGLHDGDEGWQSAERYVQAYAQFLRSLSDQQIANSVPLMEPSTRQPSSAASSTDPAITWWLNRGVGPTPARPRPGFTPGTLPELGTAPTAGSRRHRPDESEPAADLQVSPDRPDQEQPGQV
jgi:hypothetical protein